MHSADGILRPSVLIYHGERPDGRLTFMYSGIVGTLSAGFGSLGLTVTRGVLPAHEFIPGSTTRAGTVALTRATDALVEGDAFMWVGVKQHALPPWKDLGSRGVHRLYYQTEPLSAMEDASPTRASI